MSLITIVQGEDRTLTFTLQEVDSNGITTYLDLTGATEIEVKAAGTSGTVSFKLTAAEVSILDSVGGVFKVQMVDSKTSLLRVAPDQNLEVIIDIGSHPSGQRRIAQLLKAISVVRRLFP